MRILTKIINSPIKDYGLFTLRDRPHFLFTYQNITENPLVPEKPSGFYIECYEQKNQGKLVGYVYAGIKGNKLELDMKNKVLTNPRLKELMRNMGLKDYRRHEQKRVVNAVKVQKRYSVKGANRHESHKGFGKLLIRLAIETGLTQYQLKKLFIYCTEESYYFYHHILRIPPGVPQKPNPYVFADLQDAYENIAEVRRPIFFLNGEGNVGAGDRVRTDGN